MEKKVSSAFGKKQYLIGSDKQGVLYWLEEATFDCNWFWGIGYVETFACNQNPELSRDINSHQHLSGIFDKNQNANAYDNFKAFFSDHVLTDKEVWKFVELSKALYKIREYSDLLHIGGSHYTENPCSDIIKNDSEYKRINDVVIPAVLKEIYKLLGENND